MESVPFGSSSYLAMLGLLLFSRGMDFFSTWVATPNLALEGNPIAKRLGWKWGALFNLAICLIFSFWQLAAIIISTTGFLVAAHNFQSAWLMRTLGEYEYRELFASRIGRKSFLLFIVCLFGETFLTALIGGAIVYFSPEDSIVFAIGVGILIFTVIVFFFTSLGMWRIRQQLRR